MKKKIGLIVLLVIGIIAVVGVVSAQAQTQTPTAPSANTPIMQQLLQIVAGDLDMQPQDILQQMRGQTLAQIIQANNGDLTKITSDLTTAITDRVNQAVANGTLTQDRANQILGNLSTTIQNALQGNGAGLLRSGQIRQGLGRIQQGLGLLRRGLGGRLGQGGIAQGVQPGMLRNDVGPLLSAVESATGLSGQQIAQAVRGGQTLGDVITQHNGSADSVINAAIAQVTQKLDQARQNGTLTQDEEDSIVNGLKAFYQAVVDGAFRQQAQPTQGAI